MCINIKLTFCLYIVCAGNLQFYSVDIPVQWNLLWADSLMSSQPPMEGHLVIPQNDILYTNEPPICKATFPVSQECRFYSTHHSNAHNDTFVAGFLHFFNAPARQQYIMIRVDTTWMLFDNWDTITVYIYIYIYMLYIIIIWHLNITIRIGDFLKFTVALLYRDQFFYWTLGSVTTVQTFTEPRTWLLDH